ncbi:MAG: hypothetical protein KAR16_06295 [Bacteroidales bacterium]|nr:hypothetical protein [Bacteroidales bacterium]
MRYTILFILVIAAVSFTACEKPIDYEKERADIIAVINLETDAYLARDFETCCATHVHDSLNMRLTAGPDSYVFLEGWEQVGKHLSGDETEDDLSPNLNITVEKSNFRMRIYPSSAFVVCDQLWTSKFDDDVTEISSIQVRLMEKIEGEWKISFVSWVGTKGYNMDETEELFD